MQAALAADLAGVADGNVDCCVSLALPDDVLALLKAETLRCRPRCGGVRDWLAQNAPWAGCMQAASSAHMLRLCHAHAVSRTVAHACLHTPHPPLHRHTPARWVR